MPSESKLLTFCEYHFYRFPMAKDPRSLETLLQTLEKIISRLRR